jgi:hypothetical protein
MRCSGWSKNVAPHLETVRVPMPFFMILVVVLMPLAIAPGFSFYFDVVPKKAILLSGVALFLLTSAFRAAAFKASRFRGLAVRSASGISR